ncbi:SCO family protein [Luteimonas sp. A277]
MFNRTTLIILVVALAAGLGLLAAQKILSGPGSTGAQPETRAISLFPQPRELPDFAMQQSDGTQLLPGELHGHWTIVFIGFTFCPDVCPMTLTQLGQAQRQWEDIPDGVRPRVLFVSVDPERDTPDRIGDYISAFHRDTLGATADIPALEEFTRSLSLVFMKVPAPDGVPEDQYSIDHSSAMAILDPQARMAGVLQGPLDPEAIAADLRMLTEASRN